MELTPEERSTNYATLLHIRNVGLFMNRMIKIMLDRSANHDRSKLHDPELGTFTEYTPKLKTAEYNSPEYKQFLVDMKPALDHHYANNPHHPEYYPNGVAGMNLIDLMEMLCDWKAAGLRSKNGDLRKSIEANAERFKLDPQLKAILLNTVPLVNGDVVSIEPEPWREENEG